LINLSREDESFLRHRMIDEFHYEEGQGQAERLQVGHGANPADFGNLVAEVIPDPIEQEATGDSADTIRNYRRILVGAAGVGEELSIFDRWC
jgi:hypothetical protein